MFASLTAIPKSLVRHHYLIWQLSWREIIGRYRGSLIGLLWPFILPLIMLAMYTLIFGVVFKARWPAQSGGIGESHADFALILFVGLILHGFLSECLGRAPTLVLGNVNLVKRVVFPLDVLGWTTVFTALFHGAVSFIILVAIFATQHGAIPWTILLLPLVLAPFALLVLGLVWFLAAMGVFLRDIGQAIQPITTVLLFISPVLFPTSALPDGLRLLVALNPVTIPVEQARLLAIWGTMPDWGVLGAYSVAAVLVAWAGSYWFHRAQPAFADVM